MNNVKILDSSETSAVLRDLNDIDITQKFFKILSYIKILWLFQWTS